MRKVKDDLLLHSPSLLRSHSALWVSFCLRAADRATNMMKRSPAAFILQSASAHTQTHFTVNCFHQVKVNCRVTPWGVTSAWAVNRTVPAARSENPVWTSRVLLPDYLRRREGLQKPLPHEVSYQDFTSSSNFDKRQRRSSWSELRFHRNKPVYFSVNYSKQQQMNRAGISSEGASADVFDVSHSCSSSVSHPEEMELRSTRLHLLSSLMLKHLSYGGKTLTEVEISKIY